jgi:hypothetical protein
LTDLSGLPVSRAVAEPDVVLAAVRRAVDEAIAAGADVIIPAEGVIAELLVAQGVTEIEGVCVMDSVGAVVLHAQMLATLRSRTGLHPGRRWHFPKPPNELLQQLDEGRTGAPTVG